MKKQRKHLTHGEAIAPQCANYWHIVSLLGIEANDWQNLSVVEVAEKKMGNQDQKMENQKMENEIKRFVV